MSDEMRSGMDVQQMMDELRKPFHPSHVTWKPGVVKGERALALAYADLHAYMDRLDEVCGFDWSVSYEPWGVDRIICRLTIAGVTRSSTGETTDESERSEIGGTVAEAQAFKRAGTMFGLGRYLYNLPSTWADYDPSTRQFTGQAKAKLTNTLVQHYRRALGAKAEPIDPVSDGMEPQQEGQRESSNGNDKAKMPVESEPSNGTRNDARALRSLFERFNTLGQDLYGTQWAEVSQRNVHRISGGKTDDGADLTAEQIEKLISGMMKVKSKRGNPVDAVAAQN